MGGAEKLGDAIVLKVQSPVSECCIEKESVIIVSGKIFAGFREQPFLHEIVMFAIIGVLV